MHQIELFKLTYWYHHASENLNQELSLRSFKKICLFRAVKEEPLVTEPIVKQGLFKTEPFFILKS